MAKLCNEERAAMESAYQIGVHYGMRATPASERNPFLWSSRLWEAWEIGDYLSEKGMALGDRHHWERGRGNTFRNADGLTLKLHYGAKGCSFGIVRAS